MQQLEQVNAWSSRQPARLQSLSSKRNGFPVTLCKLPTDTLRMAMALRIGDGVVRLKDSRNSQGQGLADIRAGLIPVRLSR
ncbi:hypothetical protein SuUB7_20430 [Streptococcus uberis]